VTATPTTRPDVTGPGRRLDPLDYLRFTAALMVVAYHYLAFGVTTGLLPVSATPLFDAAKYGYLGVDLFFLISGFVIMNSARGKSARRFAVSRARRLLPAFWPSMLLTALVIHLFGHRVDVGVTWRQVLVNLIMIPTELGQPAVDGVYWTLVFEIYFYMGVFIALALGLGRFIGPLVPAWALGIALLEVAAPSLSSLPLAGGYYAYFAIGAILAEVRNDGKLTLLRAAGLAAGLWVVIRWSASQSEMFARDQGMTLNRGIVMGVVLVGVGIIAAMCLPRVAEIRLPAARTVGLLTYPLYLLHASLGYIVMSFVITDGNKWIVYPLVLLAIMALSRVVLLIEALPFWKTLIEGSLGRALWFLDRPDSMPRREQPPSHSTR
jgi:peptidoglycan/LPS O-acetylase OafA/YrhL